MPKVIHHSMLVLDHLYIAIASAPNFIRDRIFCGWILRAFIEELKKSHKKWFSCISILNLPTVKVYDFIIA